MGWRTKQTEVSKRFKMTEFEQQLLKYLQARKTAATVKQIAKYFIRSESYITSNLKFLEEKGLIVSQRIGGMKIYAVNNKRGT
jgi:DNA-binding MarR family transcriptional regulator